MVSRLYRVALSLFAVALLVSAGVPDLRAATSQQVFFPLVRRANGNRLLVTATVDRYGFCASSTSVVQYDGTGLVGLPPYHSSTLCQATVNASWSPNGMAIAYVSFQQTGSNGTGVSALRLANADVSQVITLTTSLDLGSTITNSRPIWSPDSSRLAFTTKGGTFITDVNARTTRRSSSETGALTWSPDSSRLLVNSTQLVSIDAAGKIQGIALGNIAGAAWSPNSRQVAFLDVDKLVVYTVASEALLKLADDVTNSAWFAWSPDSQHIAYQNAQGVTTVQVDGSRTRTIRGATSFAWAPSGDQIAIVADSASPGESDDQRRNVYLAAPDFSTIRGMISPSFSNAGWGSVGWSPDGSILYVYDLSTTEASLTLTTRIGQQLATIPISQYGSQVAWSHDSQFFIVNTKFIHSLYYTVYQRDGTRLNSMSGNATWSPD